MPKRQTEKWSVILKDVVKKQFGNILLFILALVMFLGVDFSCERKMIENDGKADSFWLFHFKIKDIDKKIPKR